MTIAVVYDDIFSAAPAGAGVQNGNLLIQGSNRAVFFVSSFLNGAHAVPTVDGVNMVLVGEQGAANSLIRLYQLTKVPAGAAVAVSVNCTTVQAAGRMLIAFMSYHNVDEINPVAEYLEGGLSDPPDKRSLTYTKAVKGSFVLGSWNHINANNQGAIVESANLTAINEQYYCSIYRHGIPVASKTEEVSWTVSAHNTDTNYFNTLCINPFKPKGNIGMAFADNQLTTM